MGDGFLSFSSGPHFAITASLIECTGARAPEASSRRGITIDNMGKLFSAAGDTGAALHSRNLGLTIQLIIKHHPKHEIFGKNNMVRVERRTASVWRLWDKTWIYVRRGSWQITSNQPRPARLIWANLMTHLISITLIQDQNPEHKYQKLNVKHGKLSSWSGTYFTTI